MKVRVQWLAPPLTVSTSTSPLPGDGRGSVVTASLAAEGKKQKCTISLGTIVDQGLMRFCSGEVGLK